jgi:hypothetical protein
MCLGTGVPGWRRRHALNADSIQASSSAELWTVTNFVTTWPGFIWIIGAQAFASKG